MRHLKLFEDFRQETGHRFWSNPAYQALLKFYSVAELEKMGLGNAPTEDDVKDLYYRECKKDHNKISPRLVELLAEECISTDDIETFSFLASKYPLQITAMGPFQRLLQITAKFGAKHFAKKLLAVLSYEHDGAARLKEVVKRHQPDPMKFEATQLWILEFLFDEGIIATDGSKPEPFDVDFTALPTPLIEKMGKDAYVIYEDILSICKQASWTDIEKRMALFASLPPFWEFLKKNPDVIDTKMGLGVFSDFMPKDKATEINHIRRGNQSGKKFGF